MDCQKSLFSLKEGHHYLNCAYKAPLLKAAELAGKQAMIREQNPFEISSQDFFNQVVTLKEEFSILVNTRADAVATIPSASYGFASVLNNIKPKSGGHAITMNEEFPSGYYALERWCMENGNTLKVIGPEAMQKQKGKSWNDNILHAIDKNTSVVLISSIHWVHGYKFDLEAIGEKCAAVGAVFVVDGTQSVGILPMDIQKFRIDALVCAGYKWLLGPYSLGVAHIGEKLATGKPLEESWINRSNAKDFSRLTDYVDTYTPQSGRYNVGQSANFILTPMLLAALKQINAWQPENMQQYCMQLAQPLYAYLEANDIPFENGDFTAKHLFAIKLHREADTQRCKANLSANNIYTSPRGEYIRISLNVFNDANDIQKLINTIEQSLQR